MITRKKVKLHLLGKICETCIFNSASNNLCTNSVRSKDLGMGIEILEIPEEKGCKYHLCIKKTIL